MTTKLIRLPEVIDMTGMSKSSVYKQVRLGKFPKPLSLGNRSVAWSESLVFEWIQLRLDAAHS